MVSVLAAAKRKALTPEKQAASCFVQVARLFGHQGSGPTPRELRELELTLHNTDKDNDGLRFFLVWRKSVLLWAALLAVVSLGVASWEFDQKRMRFWELRDLAATNTSYACFHPAPQPPVPPCTHECNWGEPDVFVPCEPTHSTNPLAPDYVKPSELRYDLSCCCTRTVAEDAEWQLLLANLSALPPPPPPRLPGCSLNMDDFDGRWNISESLALLRVGDEVFDKFSYLLLQQVGHARAIVDVAGTTLGLEVLLVLANLFCIVGATAACYTWATLHRSRHISLLVWLVTFSAPFAVSVVPVKRFVRPGFSSTVTDWVEGFEVHFGVRQKFAAAQRTIDSTCGYLEWLQGPGSDAISPETIGQLCDQVDETRESTLDGLQNVAQRFERARATAERSAVQACDKAEDVNDVPGAGFISWLGTGKDVPEEIVEVCNRGKRQYEAATEDAKAAYSHYLDEIKTSNDQLLASCGVLRTDGEEAREVTLAKLQSMRPLCNSSQTHMSLAAATLETPLVEQELLLWYVDKGQRAANLFVSLEQALRSLQLMLPAAISLAPAIIAGAVQVKALVPASTIPGMFIVVLPVFYSPLVWAVYNILSQLVGSVWMVAGLLGLAIRPLGYSVLGIFMGVERPVTPARFARINRAFGMWGALSLFTSLLLLAHALFWSDDIKADVSPIIQTVLSDLIAPSSLVILAFTTAAQLLRTRVAGADFMAGTIASQRSFEVWLDSAQVGDEIESAVTRLTALPPTDQNLRALAAAQAALAQLFATEKEREYLRELMSRRNAALDDLCRAALPRRARGTALLASSALLQAKAAEADPLAGARVAQLTRAAEQQLMTVKGSPPPVPVPPRSIPRCSDWSSRAQVSPQRWSRFQSVDFGPTV